MSAWAEMQVVALNIPCSYCGAAVGERCVSKFGRSASNIHRARFAPVQSAFNIGYRTAERAAVEVYDQDRDDGGEA